MFIGAPPPRSLPEVEGMEKLHGSPTDGSHPMSGQKSKKHGENVIRFRFGEEPLK